MKGTKNKNYIQRLSHRFYKYFLSYILLLVMVLSVMGTVVYYGFSLTMKKEANKSNHFSVTQLKNTLDMRLKEMERIALNIDFNYELKYHNVSNENYEELKAVRELKQYISSTEFIYDIALHYRYYKDSKVYTTNTVMNLDMFLDYFYKFEDWDQETYANMSKNIDTPLMYSISEAVLNNWNREELARYVYPIMVGTVSPHKIVVFFIKKNVIMDILKSILGDYEGYVYIIDRQNNPVFFYINDKLYDGSAEALNKFIGASEKDNTGNVAINGNSYSVAGVTSDYNGWSYIVARRTDQIMEPVNRNLTVFGHVIILLLVFGLFFAFTFSMRQYRPWQRLIEMISNRDRGNTQKYSDEFDYVANSITTIADECENLSNQLRSKRTLIKNEFIRSILKGKMISPNEMKSMEDIYGVKFKYTHFIVLLFRVDDFGKYIFRDDSRKAIQDLASFGITNLIEELSMDIGFGYSAELEDAREIALLLNADEKNLSKRNIYELASKTMEYFSANFDYTLTVGVGDICQEFDMICESFFEANRALYYRLIKGSGNILFYGDIAEAQSRNHIFTYPVKLEDALIMAVKTGKNDDIAKIAMELKEYLTSNNINIEAVQCICFGIVNAIMNLLGDIHVDTSHCLKNEEELQLLVQPFDTVDTFIERVINFSSVICNYLKGKKESKNFELRDKIIDIIKRNYRDSSLCLESISVECGMTPSYISRYFKDQTGYSLMQYVDMYRMNEVKRLLKETDIPVKDIITEVGYVDRSSFYRSFKKKEGMPPAEYRILAEKTGNTQSVPANMIV